MDNNYKPKEFAELLNVSVLTLQRWDNAGKLKAFRTPTNRRYYTYEQYKDLPAKKVYNFVTIESFKYDILKKEVNKLSQEEIEKIYLFSYNDNPLSFEKSEVIDVTHWMDDKVEEMINSR